MVAAGIRVVVVEVITLSDSGSERIGPLTGVVRDWELLRMTPAFLG